MFQKVQTEDKINNDSQFEVVEKIAQRVCDEMNALASGDDESLSEPLRWSMHGGPGTGKTNVIKIIKDKLIDAY